MLIGFTVAGFMKAFVPTEFWNALFLQGVDANFPSALVTLENVLVAPFVAAATFIGSMGNIPLATVLAGSGVGFAGLMAFIYSDLMVPPLVKVNARYYGWKVALFIAGVMYVSIVATALLLDTGFGLLGMRPETAATSITEQQFAIDYTLFFNIAFVVIAAVLITLHRRHLAAGEHGGHDPDQDQGIDIQKYVAWLAIFVLATGMMAFALTN
ncbi:MAG: permease [Xanthomonadales bacterium]|nr:permease [Xanthomonadales bacterium]